MQKSNQILSAAARLQEKHFYPLPSAPQFFLNVC